MTSSATETADQSRGVFGGFSQSAANDVAAARRADQRVFEAIDRLGLRQHVWDLDTRGYTVLPPDTVAPPALAQELLAQILAAAERNHGVTADVDKGLSG